MVFSYTHQQLFAGLLVLHVVSMPFTNYRILWCLRREPNFFHTMIETAENQGTQPMPHWFAHNSSISNVPVKFGMWVSTFLRQISTSLWVTCEVTQSCQCVFLSWPFWSAIVTVTLFVARTYDLYDFTMWLPSLRYPCRNRRIDCGVRVVGMRPGSTEKRDLDWFPLDIGAFDRNITISAHNRLPAEVLVPPSYYFTFCNCHKNDTLLAGEHSISWKHFHNETNLQLR